MCCIFGGGFCNSPYMGGYMLPIYPSRVMHSIHHGQCKNFGWGFGFATGIGVMNLTGALLNRLF